MRPELALVGISLPVFEEFGSGQAALHIADELARNALLSDTAYRRRSTGVEGRDARDR